MVPIQLLRGRWQCITDMAKGYILIPPGSSEFTYRRLRICDFSFHFSILQTILRRTGGRSKLQIYSSSASGFWIGPFPSILVVACDTVA